MIYRTDDAKYVVNLMSLRKTYYENKLQNSNLGKIYVTEFWDKNHHQNIVTNAKLMDKARNLGKYEVRNSYVNFQEILDKRQRIEERDKKLSSPIKKEINFWGSGPSWKKISSSKKNSLILFDWFFRK